MKTNSRLCTYHSIPYELRASKRSNIRVIRMRNLALGAVQMKLGEYSVQIFDPEGCIVDPFRYLDLLGAF